jgi:hypothetical protein
MRIASDVPTSSPNVSASSSSISVSRVFRLIESRVLPRVILSPESMYVCTTWRPSTKVPLRLDRSRSRSPFKVR